MRRQRAAVRRVGDDVDIGHDRRADADDRRRHDRADRLRRHDIDRHDLSNYTWTEGCNQDCTKQYHLYCFEQ
jgi:hypothetical protein